MALLHVRCRQSFDGCIYTRNYRAPVARGHGLYPLLLGKWEQDTRYFYYLHGSLARIELGHDKVQGIDYAYTLHGWLKAANSKTTLQEHDICNDANTSQAKNSNKYFARDAFGFSLDYYQSDYTAIGPTNFITNKTQVGGYSIIEVPSLYNGNIRSMVTAICDNNNKAQPQMALYRYEQLNRIKKAAYKGYVSEGNTCGDYIFDKYSEEYNYDFNGNILNLRGNGETMEIDRLTYNYKPKQQPFAEHKRCSGNAHQRYIQPG